MESLVDQGLDPQASRLPHQQPPPSADQAIAPVPEQLVQAATEVARLGDSAASFAVHTDTQLMQGHDQITALRRQVDRYAAWMAGEIARRSTRDLGYAGLAQRNGFLTPEAMIQATSGSTRTDATRLVAVGTMLNQTEAAEELQRRDPGSPFAELPWLASVAGVRKPLRCARPA